MTSEIRPGQLWAYDLEPHTGKFNWLVFIIRKIPLRSSYGDLLIAVTYHESYMRFTGKTMSSCTCTYDSALLRTGMYTLLEDVK